MQLEQDDGPRVETLAAALIHLMTHYARNGCPRIALCISRHMQCLALHPKSPLVLRDTCASLHGAWSLLAGVGSAPLPH